MTEEINELLHLHIDKTNFVCKVHEDNQSCINMATGTKLFSIKNNIALRYHHSKSHVKIGRVDISYTRTNHQREDLQKKL